MSQASPLQRRDASEIDSFVVSNYAKIFEDEQRSHNEEIVDSVCGEAHSGREVHLNNETYEDKQS